MLLDCIEYLRPALRKYRCLEEAEEDILALEERERERGRGGMEKEEREELHHELLRRRLLIGRGRDGPRKRKRDAMGGDQREEASGMNKEDKSEGVEDEIKNLGEAEEEKEDNTFITE